MNEGDDIDVPASGPRALETAAIADSAAVDALAASTPTSPTAPISGDAAIAEALASGRIDAVAAGDRLIDEVVAEQLGAAATPDTLARVGETLRGLLADDPTLARLLRRV